ncbi:MAG: cyclic nucleotide-binding domain-containing protein [Bacteroidetes bacterium]|nr:cyclic nucleotide-binding domain-containing protein [Bacteroidota bacterium]
MLEIEFLKKFPLFAGLSDVKLKSLKTIIREADYPVGSVIIKDGDRGNEMFLLIDGDVEITKQMMIKMDNQDTGSKDKSLLRLSSKYYACFGEMALFEEKSERSATVSAVTACKVGILTQEEFTRLVQTDFELGYIIFRNLSKIISDRLKKASKDILKLTTAFVLAVEK